MQGFVFLLIFHVLVTTSAQNSATIFLPATGARVCETRNITLQCRVVFNNVTVPGTWSRNGTIIDDDNDTLNHHIIFNSTGEGLTNLIITNVTQADNNTEYMCSYSGGVITPDNVTLHVAGIRFVNRLSTRFRCLRKILSIDPATNDPVCGPVSITMTVSPSDGVVITQPKAFTYNISGLADIVYTIRWTGVHDGHLYRLFASIGKFPAPSPPYSIITTDTCTNDATISWNAFSFDLTCGRVTYYAVAISSSDGVITKTVTNTSSFNFTGLVPGSSYNVSVASGTYAGVGEAKFMILNTSTVEDATPTGVFNLTNTTYEAESIHVEWSDTGSSSYCGGNESLYYLFIVSIRRQVVFRRISHNRPSLGHGQVRYREIFTGLNDDTNYTVTIIAVNRAGNGANEAIYVMTAESSGTDSSKMNSCCFIILGICSCGLTIIIWYIYENLIEDKTKVTKDAGDEPLQQTKYVRLTEATST
ncbi:receptor-type tyrosine-protein phosphatase eta-like isoform X2 [Dysidea avara]|uniref:receptor-type tyrosine-protein phosphatase eta-like isoform X2 n=1 Tax=Dysidea avara TaxID=196820 RepID=UPI00331E5CD6